MCSAFYGVNVVNVRVYVFRIVRVVHHGNFDWYALLLGLQVYHVVEEVCAVAVYVAHELLQAVDGMEHLLACLAILVRTKVSQRYLYAGVKVSQLAHALGYDFVFEDRRGEYRGVRPELLARSAQFGVANYFYRIQRFARLVLLLVYVAVAEHLRHHPGRQGVDARNADTVETARHLVRAFVKLSSCVQHGHHDLQRRLVQFLMFVHRYASTVVLYGYRVIFVNRNFNVSAISGHCLVDRVVDGLVHQVVETFLADVANVHSGALAHGLKTLEHLYVTGRIIVLVDLIFCHFCLRIMICKGTKKKPYSEILILKISLRESSFPVFSHEKY